MRGSGMTELARLRGMRRHLAYLIALNGFDERLRPALIGLEARAKALDVCLDLEARVATLEAGLRGVDGLDLDDYPARVGEARAERARLTARVRAEARAYEQVLRIFAIRSRAVRAER